MVICIEMNLQFFVDNFFFFFFDNGFSVDKFMKRVSLFSLSPIDFISYSTFLRICPLKSYRKLHVMFLKNHLIFLTPFNIRGCLQILLRVASDHILLCMFGTRFSVFCFQK
jgi:hypothetical protein